MSKIILPAVLISAVALVIGYLNGERYDAVSVLFNLCQLQGLAFFLPGIGLRFTGHSMLGPLWFLTVIMLCYCLTPVLQKLRGYAKGRTFFAWTAAAAAVCFALCMTVQINLFFFLTFALGYFLRAGEVRMDTKHIAALSFGVLPCQLVRLLLRSFADGTTLYQTYTYLSHLALGLWILCFFLWCGEKIPTRMDGFANSKLVSALDERSLYVYMVHGLFCGGLLSPYTSVDNLFLATVLFLVYTAVCAWLLCIVTKAVTKVYR